MIIQNSYPTVVLNNFEVWAISIDSHYNMYTKVTIDDCIKTIKFIKRK